MKHRYGVAACYLDLEGLAERQTGRFLGAVQSERGGGYLCAALEKHFRSCGVERKLTTAYSPHQNGEAKQVNRTMLDLFRSMLQHKSIAKCLWASVLSAPAYVIDKKTSRTLPVDKTAHHLWKISVSVLAHLRDFGSKSWYATFESFVRKLDSWSRLAFYIYAERSNAYNILDTETHNVVVSRDVVFKETAEWPPSFYIRSRSVSCNSHQKELL